MPNLKGGKNYKKNKKKGDVEDKFYPMATDKDQMYAMVTKLPGGTHVLVECSDKKSRLAFIRGAIRKRNWMKIGDIVLVSKREGITNDSKCDVIYKYTVTQAKQLQN